MNIFESFEKVNRFRRRHDATLFLGFKNQDIEGPKKTQYIHFENYQQAYDQINEMKIKDRSYAFETVFASNQNRKPYVFFERLCETIQEFRENYKTNIEQLMQDIIEIFKENFQINIIMDDIKLLHNHHDLLIDGQKKFMIRYQVIISPACKSYYFMSVNHDNTALCLYYALINKNKDYQNFLARKYFHPIVKLTLMHAYPKVDSKKCFEPIDATSLRKIENITRKEWNHYLISYILDDNEQIKTYHVDQANPIIFKGKKPVIPKTNLSVKLMNCVKMCHPTAKYLGLANNKYHVFGYDNRKEKCPACGKCHLDKKHNFYIWETDIGYELKCHANPEAVFKNDSDVQTKIIGYHDETDEFIHNARQLRNENGNLGRRRLLDQDFDRKNQDDLVKWVMEWADDDDIKALGIKSPMDTGKTTLLRIILQYFCFGRVLWITHRQILTHQFYGVFRDLGFKSYLKNKKNLYKKDRVIILIDSIKRVLKETSKSDYPKHKKYDLVIIDESESNLNHYASRHLDKRAGSVETFNEVWKIIKNSKKLIMTDADFGARSTMLIKKFPHIMINNAFQHEPKKFILRNDYRKFRNTIVADIKAGLNVAIASMSSEKAAKLADYLHQRVKNLKLVLHSNATDDELKQQLQNVNEFWSQFQVVIYSPTIDCGVDFNTQHFHKMYAIIVNGEHTCSQRTFLQMTGRIRQLQHRDIICYYNYKKIPNLKADVYTYRDVLAHVKYTQKLNEIKVIEYKLISREENGDIIYEKGKLLRDIKLFYRLMIYNEVERLNKNPAIFMTVLSRLIHRLGYELCFEPGNSNGPKRTTLQEKAEVLADIDVRHYCLDKLLELQRNNQATELDKNKIKKMLFMRQIKMRNVDTRSGLGREEFIRGYMEYGNKKSVISNFRRYFLDTNIHEKGDLVTLRKGNKMTKDVFVTEILNLLTSKRKKRYEIDDIEAQIIDYKTWDGLVAKFANLRYFREAKHNRAVYNNCKTRIDVDKMSQIKTVQTMLSGYGILLCSLRKRHGKQQKCDYSLSLDGKIKDIVYHILHPSQRVSGYKHIFN